MNIAPVSVNTAQTVQTQTKEPFSANIVTAPEHGQPADTVEISPRRSHQSAMDQSERTTSVNSQMLRRMAERLIKEQYEKGNELYMLLYGHKAVALDPSLRPGSSIPEPETDIQRQAVVNAKEHFGPVQTSRRILDTAQDIAGTEPVNPAMVETFRGAVKAAFSNVQTELGGELPELTKNTYDATMQGFDAWLATGTE